MSSRRVVRFVVLIAMVAAVLPWPATPALAFTEGPSNNFFGTSPPNNTGTENSFFGGSAGVSNTSGLWNSFFGRSAGDSNTIGGENAFFGGNAGSSNTSGSFNAFFGMQAGEANVGGSSNAFFGRAAGLSNTASDNAFFGAANTEGNDNAFFGSVAGRFNTAGNRNAFFGRSAGAANTTASDNSFFGGRAGELNDTGFSNAFFGTLAGAANTAGNDNSFFGRSSGRDNTTGFNNTFVGNAAGFDNTTGSDNSFFGQFAGLSNTTESGNTFVGSLANGVAGLTNATAIGHRAQVSGVNRLVLGSIAGLNGATQNVRVGIGTAAPAEPLHVRRTDGTAKVLVQEASGTLLGRELFELINNGAARFRVSNTSNGATWDFQSSSGGGSFVIDRVGGPSSLDFEMQPDGDLVVRGSVTGTSFISSSDRNLKTEITPANASKLMSMLRQLDISTWRFKNEPKGTVNLGPMAQDFHRLFGMGTETTIDVRDLAALALVAAQVLDEDNANQQSEIQSQRKEIDSLKRAVAELASSEGER